MCFLLLSLLMLKEGFATGGRREGAGKKKSGRHIRTLATGKWPVDATDHKVSFAFQKGHLSKPSSK